MQWPAPDPEGPPLTTSLCGTPLSTHTQELVFHQQLVLLVCSSFLCAWYWDGPSLPSSHTKCLLNWLWPRLRSTWRHPTVKWQHAQMDVHMLWGYTRCEVCLLGSEFMQICLQSHPKKMLMTGCFRPPKTQKLRQGPASANRAVIDDSVSAFPWYKHFSAGGFNNAYLHYVVINSWKPFGLFPFYPEDSPNLEATSKYSPRWLPPFLHHVTSSYDLLTWPSLWIDAYGQPNNHFQQKKKHSVRGNDHWSMFFS